MTYRRPVYSVIFRKKDTDILELPIVDEGYGNYDGVLFGFSDREPGFWIWNENKWGAATEKANLVFYVEDLDAIYAMVHEKAIW